MILASRMIYSLSLLDREDPFQRLIGWRDDLIQFDPLPGASTRLAIRTPATWSISARPTRGSSAWSRRSACKADLVVMNLGNLFRAQESGILETLAKVDIPVLFVDFRQRRRRTRCRASCCWAG